MSDLADMLANAYPDDSVSTADVLTRMPSRSRMAGMFSGKSMPTVADLLRGSQGGMLTPEQAQAGYGETPKDVLAGVDLPAWLRPGFLPDGLQKAAGAGLGMVPPEAWLAASLMGPKAAANLAKAGDMRPQRALDAAKEINARMVAEGASTEDINTAIHNTTAKIMGAMEPQKWRAVNPETGRMKRLPAEDSPYGGVVRVPSHLDNPPRYLSDDELVAHNAAREGYRANPDFAFEVSDAGPRGLTIHEDQLRRPWYAPWKPPRGTQTGVEGPLFEHPMLAKAYPELKDWEFTLEKRPQDGGVGGYTDRAAKEVFASAPISSGGYYGSGTRMDRARGGDKRDLPAVLTHEGTHTALGAIEGMPNQGGNPGMVALGKKFRRIWGGRDDPLSDALGMPGFAAHMNYERIPGEWMARRVQDRSGWPAKDLRRVPFIDNDLIGTENLPARAVAFPKRKRGEPAEAFTKRYDEYNTQNPKARRDAERYPGDSGWTEPTTGSDIFWGHTLPKWWGRTKVGGTLGGVGGGVYALGKSIEEEPVGENAPTPKDLAESPLGRAILKEYDNAAVSKWVAAGRLGAHGGVVPFSPVGGWIGRLGWGSAQAGLASGAWDDMKKAERDRQFWEAQRRGYLNRLPQLNTETVE